MFKVQCEVTTIYDLRLLCVSWHVQPSTRPFSEQFYGDAGFLFQQDLAAARSVKITAEWFADHVIIVLDW